MAFSSMLILEIVIVFSFIVTSVFMFATKDKLVHKIFFALSIMLGILVVAVAATSFPVAELTPEIAARIIMTWAGLIPLAISIILAVAKGEPGVASKILAMLASVYGVICYFFL